MLGFGSILATAAVIVVGGSNLSSLSYVQTQAEKDLTKPLPLTPDQEAVYLSNHMILDNEFCSDAQHGGGDFRCACGRVNQFRIVGGSETSPNEYPWMVYLVISKDNSSFLCGGFLISDRHILTAAHCALGVSDEGIRAVLGDHDRSVATDAKSVLMRSDKIAIHPRYNRPRRNDNDIAVVTLKQQVAFGTTISPVCLPNFAMKNANYTGQVATVMGWGRVSIDGPVSNLLMHAQVPIISNERCRSDYEGIAVPITTGMLCAGSPLGGRDSCQGDSGGPLVIKGRDRYFVIGIVSFGFSCANPDFPGVYTRVDRMLRFVLRHTRDGVFCPA